MMRLQLAAAAVITQDYSTYILCLAARRRKVIAANNNNERRRRKIKIGKRILHPLSFYLLYPLTDLLSSSLPPLSFFFLVVSVIGWGCRHNYTLYGVDYWYIQGIDRLYQSYVDYLGGEGWYVGIGLGETANRSRSLPPYF